MSKKSSGVGRGSFLAGIATAGAGAAVSAVSPASAAPATDAATFAGRTKLSAPSTAVLAADTQPFTLTRAPDKEHIYNPGSDYMVDVLKAFNIDFLATMPGSTFRGIHESLINYGKNTMPEMISVVHEEISASLAHGYGKVKAKPMAILVHNTVGLQHASMGLYNAWCDRVPMLVLVGNILDAAQRRPGVEWYHTAVDVAAIVRGFIKYDDSPISLDHFRESATRAYQLGTTPPYGPSLIMVDADLAETGVKEAPGAVTPYHAPHIATGDANTVDEIAKMLVNAQNPLILTGRTARTAAGMPLVVQLAELLQIPVRDDFARQNFPSNHYLNQTFNRAVVGQADVILALEVGDLFGVVEDVPDLVVRSTKRHIKADTKVIEINSELGVGAGNYQDKQRFYPSDIPVPADAEATLPSLIEAVKRNLTSDRKAQNDARAAHYRTAFIATRMAARQAAAVGWDSSPISVARMCAELWNQVKHEDWALVSQSQFQSRWPQRLWDFTKPNQYNGDSGGGGVGYSMPSAAGAALAFKGTGRFPIAIVGDGEFMVAPGTLWTLAHHEIPLLTVMHNNRAYHQEVMHVQRMADRRDRNPTTAHIGTAINSPNIDFAKLAQSFGVWSQGPISNPAQLASAFAAAIKVVKSGKPALLDIVTQPR